MFKSFKAFKSIKLSNITSNFVKLRKREIFTGLFGFFKRIVKSFYNISKGLKTLTSTRISSS